MALWREREWDDVTLADIAERAGVNKTTIYRRWPLKSDLVQAALFSFAQDVTKQPDTGSLRGDLMELGRGMAGAACTAHGQGMFRVLMAERHPDLMAIERALRKTFESVPLNVVAAAVTRGELRPGLDPRLEALVLRALRDTALAQPEGSALRASYARVWREETATDDDRAARFGRATVTWALEGRSSGATPAAAQARSRAGPIASSMMLALVHCVAQPHRSTTKRRSNSVPNWVCVTSGWNCTA